MQKANVYSLAVGLLGAAKLIGESFGFSFIDNTQIDAMANGIATLFVVEGVFVNHFKHPQQNNIQQ